MRPGATTFRSASASWAASLVLALAVLATYAPGLGNALVYDDHEVIEAQPPLHGLADLARLFREPHFRGLPYYRPVTRATLLVQRTLHGAQPAPFHAVNALLMAAAALVAFALLRRPGLGVRPAPAFLAALLFGVHPVAASCVYPAASGRETLLPALLALVAIYAHLRRGWRWRALATAAFAAALFAKEQAVVVPALFVLADVLGVSDSPPGASARRWLLRYAPLVPVLAAYFAARAALFGGSEWRLAVLDAPFGPALSLLYALQTAFVPFAALAYEPDTAVWWSPARLALALGATAALAAAAARSAPAVRRVALFFAGWWLVTLLPTARLLHQEAPYDERYVFLALLAPLGLAAAVLSQPTLARQARQLALRAGLALAALASLTSTARARFFRDDAAFATQWLRTNPASPEAHHLLGLVRAQAGDLDGALAEEREAVRLEPSYVDARVNLGTTLAMQGRREEARAELEQALRVAPDHPEALNNLGLLLAAEGRLDDAIVQYRAALRAEPAFAEAHNNLGTALARRGDLAAAVQEFESALRLAPDYAAARANLALAREHLAGRVPSPR